MTTIPWLTILGVIPLVGALVLLVLPRDNARLIKQVALVFSLAALVFTVVMGLQFDADSTAAFQFVESYPWIPAFGISYSLGVDGIGLVLVALATTLVPVTILAGWNDVEDGRNVKGYFAMILVLETLMIGVFSATDVFLFYVLFEIMLIPIYFLIGRYGGPNRAYAATKFLIYSLVGGLLMLAALIGLYVVSAQQLGQGTFDFAALVGLDIDPTTQKILFLGFFIAFAIKAPLWPFHTWLPDAAKESTPATAVLLIGVLDKVGTFGMIRYLLPIFPSASEFYAPIIIAMAVIGIIYGALVALGQTDMKRLFAYSSMSHFGFIALGIFVFTTWSMTGSTLYMLGHGLATAAVFLTAGFLMQRAGGSSAIATYGGVNKVAPVLAGFFLFAVMSAIALPGLASFVGEFLVLLGTFSRYVVVAVIASLGIVLAAAYGLRLYQKVATGPESPHVEGMRDLGGREVTSLVPVVLLTIVLGVFPAPVLDVVNPAVDRVMDSIGMTDPTPALAPAGGEQ
jgi:NADH-quinone oxidoreductase subunit M